MVVITTVTEDLIKKEYWGWMKSWLEVYDSGNNTDIGSKIYDWIKAQIELVNQAIKDENGEV